MSTEKKVAPKKPAAKKAAPAKKPAAKKPTAKTTAKKPASRASAGEQMVLYTIRLAPSAVDKLNARASKQGVTHAAVARSYIEAGLAKAA